jgi:hypothetical protein
MIRKITGITLAAGALFLGACHEDETLQPHAPPAVSTVDSLFDRPVWMGNSITAGYQSNGINDSTQSLSYAKLLTDAMGSAYFYRSLRMPGCIGPFIRNAANPAVRVGGANGTKCSGSTTAELPWMTNTAVPGARAIEITNNSAAPVSASNTLTQVILQFATQAQRMIEAEPTFVSMWIGNNDVLGALTNANPGLPAAVTSQVNFDAAYDAAVAQIEASTATGALLVGVVDVTNIPYASSGRVIFCAKNPGVGGCPGTVGTSPLPPLFTVNPNCAASADSIMVPWSKFVPMIGAAAGGGAQILDCSVDGTVVTPSEYAIMRNAVAGYNAKIQAVATANDWAYWNPNPALDSLRLLGQIPPFPDLTNLATGVVAFGPWISLDGVHPSSQAHKLIANYMRGVINTKYTTTIPVIP